MLRNISTQALTSIDRGALDKVKEKEEREEGKEGGIEEWMEGGGRRERKTDRDSSTLECTIITTS